MPPENDVAWTSVAPERPGGFWTATRIGYFCALAALLLITTALGLRRIALVTDLESLTQLARDARDVYLPAMHGGYGWMHDLWRDHAPDLRAWKLGWLALNGQIDARVLHLAALAVHVAAMGVLFSALAHTLRRRWVATLAVAIIAAFATPALAALNPTLDSVWSSGLVLLSLLHLTLMTRSTAGSGRWWLGLACGTSNILAATEGTASAIALVLWSATMNPRSREADANRPASLLANGLLVLGGLLLAVVRGPLGGADETFSQMLGSVVSWPFARGAWALVMWTPAVWCTARSIRQRAKDFSPLAELALLALWAIVQVIGIAAVRAHPVSAALDVFAAALLVNAACFALLPAGNTAARTRNLLFFAAWAIALLFPGPSPVPTIEADSPVALALRHGLLTGDDTPLRQLAGLADAEVRAGSQLIAEKDLEKILPASIRTPLRIEAEKNAPAPVFQTQGAPELPARDELPAFGTWSDGGGAKTGEFVSSPLTTPAPFLQFHVSGVLRPPTTSLVLRTSDGAEIAPLSGAVTATDKWRRVNFAAPAGPFRIVARDASATEWLAFTAPVEIGGLSRLAGKLPLLWPWLLAGGLALGGGLAVAAWRRVQRLSPPTAGAAAESFLAWRVVPWIAVCGYAAFFSNHLDTVAGPNDSGGYLTLAKTFVEGHLAAIPRMAFGPAAGETDITPYLTTTFHAHEDGRMSPEYPTGFPLEIWAMAQLMPLRDAVPAVMLLQLVLGVVFTWRLAKAFGLPEGWAWLAGGIVGFSPVYLFQAMQPQSDGPALVWATAAVYWAWSSRTKPWHAVLAGLATTLAVLIRPSNLLCIAPVACCLAGNWRQTFWWMLAGLPGAAFVAWYNHSLYGSWHTTGYGDMSQFFALSYIPRTLGSYARWLPEFYTPLVGLALAGPFLRSIPGRVRFVLVCWIVVFLAFYSIYWYTWDNWYNMRFVLPAAPAMVVLALLVLRHAGEKFGLALFAAGSPTKNLFASVLVVFAVFGFQWVRIGERQVIFWMHTNYDHEAAALWVREHLPANALVFAKSASNPLWYYTDQVFLRADHPNVRTSTPFYQRLVASGRPLYAVTYHWEATGFNWERDRHGSGYPDLPGTWTRIASIWDGDVYVWKQTSLAAPATHPGPKEGSLLTR